MYCKLLFRKFVKIYIPTESLMVSVNDISWVIFPLFERDGFLLPVLFGTSLLLCSTTVSHPHPAVHPTARVIERAWVLGSDWGRVCFPALPHTSCKIWNMFGSDRMTFLQVFSSKVDVSMFPSRFRSGQEHYLKPTNHPLLLLGHPIPSIQSPEIDDYSGLNTSQSKKTLRNHAQRSVTLKLFSIYPSVFTKTFS